jgi:hypothetical protein
VAAAAALVCLAAGSTALAAASVWRDPVSPTLACPPLPAGAGSRIAVLAPEPAADQLAMRLFSQSGAGFLYLRTASAKVRFRRWLATEIPDLPGRRRAIEAALGGGRPPAAADLVFARPGTVAGARVAGCRFGDQRWDMIRLG